jgi:hypothetical protein
VSYRPDLSALLVDPARVAALTDAVDRIALVDLLEVRALVGAVFGDGVQVVSSGPAGPSPPAGCWLPTSARTIDPYATESPTRSCACCGATAWYRAATGFTCAVSHPPATAATAARRSRRTDRTGFSLPSRRDEENGTEEQDVETETDVDERVNENTPRRRATDETLERANKED